MYSLSPFISLLLLLGLSLAAPLESSTNATLAVAGRSEPSEVAKRVISGRYVFTSFTDASETNLYVYTSDDATNFELWKGPAYTPPTGLLRDPSVILHTDGLYYIAYTTDWTGTNFAIANSVDMLSWKFYTTVSTASSVTTPVNTWAPEFFHDPLTGKLNIIVSLSTGSDGPFTPYVFTANDASLKSWSKPVAMSGIPGAGLGYIDSFPIYANNQYHLFTKSETSSKFIEHATAPSLTGPYTFVQTGDFAGWGQAEGPCVTKLPNGQFRLYADGFNSGKYIYSDSSDLFTWTPAQTLPDGLSGFVRHGTVMQQY